MSEILLYYRRPDPTTWVYLSSFLTIGLFFVFHRFWSIRNLDIVLLILLAPGLLAVHEGRRRHLQEFESEADAVATAKLVETKAESKAESAVEAEANSDPSIPEESVEIASEVAAEVAAEVANEIASEIAEEDNDGEETLALVPNPVSYTPKQIQRMGFIWLFIVQACILLRLLLDPLMSRRPLLDPNLSTGGLNFIGISLFVFMMANVVASNPRIQATQGPELGPGYAMMNMLPAIPTRPVSDALGGDAPRLNAELTSSQRRLATVARILAIIAHVAIVSGIVLIGRRHFGNLRAGVGCATLYLMLPYTAQMTGRVDHAVPAALLLWALLSYRRPLTAGIFMGLAGGLVYYPLFLLPLWFSFYWQRGVQKFAIGVVAMLGVLVVLLSLAGTETLIVHLRQMFGLFSPFKEAADLDGLWGLGWNPMWRFPVIVGFVILSVFFAIWPARKNLGSLISGSAAIMIAAQFWHGYGGGLYIAWFLPLLLLAIFRPNLEDRVATKVVDGPRIASTPRKPSLDVEAA